MNLITNGDIWTTQMPFIVVTTNTLGSFGAGQSRDARRRFPHLCAEYTMECLTGNMKPGSIRHYGGKLIFAATKDDWREPSKHAWIVDICKYLAIWHANRGFPGLAIPALGCGLGGLPWTWVHHEMDRQFRIKDGTESDEPIEVYAPLNYIRHHLDTTELEKIT